MSALPQNEHPHFSMRRALSWAELFGAVKKRTVFFIRLGRLFSKKIVKLLKE